MAKKDNFPVYRKDYCTDFQWKNVHPLRVVKIETLEKVLRSAKKRRRHEMILSMRKDQRREKKLLWKTRRKEQQAENAEGQLSERQLRARLAEQAEIGRTEGLMVCVDLSMEDTMTSKEHGKLAQQLRRLYGSNRRLAHPAHIHLTGLTLDGPLHRKCVEQNEGFNQYRMTITSSSHLDLFDRREITYLTPDSPTVLETVDDAKVYILGGLVDESVIKHLTQTKATEEGISTARLPIPEYMVKTGTRPSQVLTINQVFDILMRYKETNDWPLSLKEWMPVRKGYSLPHPPQNITTVPKTTSENVATIPGSQNIATVSSLTSQNVATIPTYQNITTLPRSTTEIVTIPGSQNITTLSSSTNENIATIPGSQNIAKVTTSHNVTTVPISTIQRVTKVPTSQNVTTVSSSTIQNVTTVPSSTIQGVAKVSIALNIATVPMSTSENIATIPGSQNIAKVTTSHNVTTVPISTIQRVTKVPTSQNVTTVSSSASENVATIPGSQNITTTVSTSQNST